MGMICSSSDHGIFIWHYQGQHSYLNLTTGDVFMASCDQSAFIHLKAKLNKMFDLTSKEDAILKFLNLHIVQSLAGISFNQTQHIQENIYEFILRIYLTLIFLFS